MSGNDTTRTVALASMRAGWGRELVASLPRSLRRVDDSVADLVLVDGAPGWTALAKQALAQGARTLVVIEPTIVDLASLTKLADAIDLAGADIALVSALADSAAPASLCDLLDATFGELVLDGTQSGSLAGLLLTQLRLLRAVGLDDLRLTTAAVTPAAFIIEGEGQIEGIERRIRLTGSVGAGPARIALNAHAGAATARLSWRGDAAARPVDVSLADATGLRTLPAIHEGGHRHALRSLRPAPDAPRGSLALHCFSRDLHLLQELLGAL